MATRGCEKHADRTLTPPPPPNLFYGTLVTFLKHAKQARRGYHKIGLALAKSC